MSNILITVVVTAIVVIAMHYFLILQYSVHHFSCYNIKKPISYHIMKLCQNISYVCHDYRGIPIPSHQTLSLQLRYKVTFKHVQQKHEAQSKCNWDVSRISKIIPCNKAPEWIGLMTMPFVPWLDATKMQSRWLRCYTVVNSTDII